MLVVAVCLSLPPAAKDIIFVLLLAPGKPRPNYNPLPLYICTHV